jgi:hypothetical protein
MSVLAYTEEGTKDRYGSCIWGPLLIMIVFRSALQPRRIQMEDEMVRPYEDG